MRQPPAAGPRAVEWTAMMHFRPDLSVEEGVDAFVALEGGGIEQGHAADIAESAREGEARRLYARTAAVTTPPRTAAPVGRAGAGAVGIGGAPDGSGAAGSRMKAATSAQTIGGLLVAESAGASPWRSRPCGRRAGSWAAALKAALLGMIWSWAP